VDFKTINPTPAVIEISASSGLITFSAIADLESGRTQTIFVAKKTDYCGLTDTGNIEICNNQRGITFDVLGAINIPGYLTTYNTPFGGQIGDNGYSERLEAILDVLTGGDFFVACCEINLTTIGNVVEVEFYVDLPDPGVEGTLYVVTSNADGNEGFYYWDGTASTGDYVSINNVF